MQTNWLEAAQTLSSSFFKNEAGATAIEYCLMAAGIGIAVIAGITGMQNSVESVLNAVVSMFATL